MEATSSQTDSRRGFTLIELLAVIVIIGILASLITAAAVSARRRVRQAAIRLELDNIGNALEAYKAKMGEYPPDFTDTSGDTVRRHLRRAFPRYDPSTGPFASTLNTGTYNPGSALVFWLGGIVGPNKKLTGFSANPTNPFQDSSVTKSRIGPFYDFDATRLHSVSGAMRYYPDVNQRIDDGEASPIVYFRAVNGSYDRPGGQEIFTAPDGGQVGPMKLRLKPDTPWDQCTWVNEHKYQIITAGLDGKFGVAAETGGAGRFFRSDAGYDDYNYDNITNFTDATLEDGLK